MVPVPAEFKSGIGRLHWLASTTRGDLAADTSLIQKPPKELRLSDLKEVASLLRYAKATGDATIKIVPSATPAGVYTTSTPEQRPVVTASWPSCPWR